MKNSNRFIIYCFLIGLLTVACDSKTIDFKYSPEQPKAGETVSFTNLSDTGEEWAWSYGDNMNATAKNPSHIYRKPGTYTVTLKVDGKNSLTKVKEITIYDTIPNFECSIADSIGIGIFDRVSFLSRIYNPYNYTIAYEWSVSPENIQLVSDSLKGNTLIMYFTKPGSYNVSMHVAYDELDTTIVHTYDIRDVATESVLMRKADGDYSQRIYGTMAEEPRKATYSEATELLDQAPDTALIYNRRRYQFGSDGLSVAYLDGSFPVSLTSTPVFAIMTDAIENRIYWATADSVMYLPLIDTPNNKFTKQPIKLNNLTGVTRMAKDNVKR